MRELIRKNRDRTPLKSLIPTQPNLSMANCNSDNHLAGLHAAQESGGVKVKVRTYFDPTEGVCRSLAELICIPIIRWWS